MVIEEGHNIFSPPKPVGIKHVVSCQGHGKYRRNASPRLDSITLEPIEIIRPNLKDNSAMELSINCKFHKNRMGFTHLYFEM